MHGHAERVTAVAFSPDGKTLATGGTDRVIRLWDVETATLRAVLWAAPSPDPDAAPTDWVASRISPAATRGSSTTTMVTLGVRLCWSGQSAAAPSWPRNCCRRPNPATSNRGASNNACVR